MTQHSIEELIIEGIRDRKGRDITVVDMSAIEAAPVAKFIIAQGYCQKKFVSSLVTSDQ